MAEVGQNVDGINQALTWRIDFDLDDFILNVTFSFPLIIKPRLPENSETDILSILISSIETSGCDGIAIKRRLFPLDK